jgi:hypothetical protein
MGHAVDFPYPKWGLKPSLRPSNNSLIRLTHSGLRFPHDPDIEHHLSCPKLQQPIGKGERNMSQQGGLGIAAAGRGLLPKPASVGAGVAHARAPPPPCVPPFFCRAWPSSMRPEALRYALLSPILILVTWISPFRASFECA